MILGFSEGFHDAAVTVLRDGHILFAAHSERYSEKKNDKVIHSSLKKYVDDNFIVDSVAFYENTFLKQTRQLYSGQYDKVFKSRKLTWIPNRSYYHHMSHLAAAFQCSPYQEAIGIVVDAIGEWDTISIWHCSYNQKGKVKYKKIYNIKYPSSLGLFYSAATVQCNLKPNEEEYILMGMSAYGKPDAKLYARLESELDNNLHKGFFNNYMDYSKEDIAYNAQLLLEDKLEELFNMYSDLPLVYGGGVALNCLANGKLLAGKETFIFPNPGDAGSSLGAAALRYGKQINFTHNYLGHRIPFVSDEQIKLIVDDLEAGNIVGIACGRAEFGPRALGNRSLLADPRTLEMKDKVNLIKRRQMYRPFAPVILSEHANDHFDLRLSNSYQYMQYAVNVKTNDFPATTHVDFTARVQTVPQHIRPHSRIRDILECWYERTGCPALLNTSLNIKGKPMVNTIEHANEFTSEYGIKVYHG